MVTIQKTSKLFNKINKKHQIKYLDCLKKINRIKKVIKELYETTNNAMFTEKYVRKF